MIHVKSEKEIQLMREAADILKKVLKAVEAEIKPGVTTNYLNDVAERVIKENGAKSGPLFLDLYEKKRYNSENIPLLQD